MTMGAILLIAQATTAPPLASTNPPDVELRAHVEVRDVRIEQEGPIALQLRAQPGVTDVTVERSQPVGAQSYRNLTIDARVAAWLRQEADGGVTASTEQSTGEQPQ